MRKSLFFICPTDNLESSIDNAFRHEHYYISSLGNSISFGEKMMEEIKNLIRNKNISTVTFVLSIENRIIKDALGHQVCSTITGMDDFYNGVIRNKKQLDESWQMWNPKLFILSYHLKEKIKEFKFQLNSTLLNQLSINGKIYIDQDNIFIDLYTDVDYFQCFSHN